MIPPWLYTLERLLSDIVAANLSVEDRKTLRACWRDLDNLSEALGRLAVYAREIRMLHEFGEATKFRGVQIDLKYGDYTGALAYLRKSLEIIRRYEEAGNKWEPVAPSSE